MVKTQERRVFFSGSREYEMAKAIVLRETGGPEVLRLEDVDVGAPAPGGKLCWPSTVKHKHSQARLRLAALALGLRLGWLRLRLRLESCALRLESCACACAWDACAWPALELGCACAWLRLRLLCA